MNQGTKQRIVGTVVLLALALIFLPIIFDGNGSYQAPVSSRIPNVPAISILPEPMPVRPVILGDIEPEALPSTTTDSVVENEAVDESAAEEVGISVVITESEVVDEDESAVEEVGISVAITESEAVFSRETPQLNAAGLPEGWSVRLGSFSDADNANKLIARLQDAGYKAYTRDIAREQGSLTGVFVGPWLDRAQVNDYKLKLQQEFSLAGLVVRYELESL